MLVNHTYIKVDVTPHANIINYKNVLLKQKQEKERFGNLSFQLYSFELSVYCECLRLRFEKFFNSLFDCFGNISVSFQPFVN